MGERILEIRQLASDKGIASGVMAVDLPDSVMRRDQGFGMVGLGSDAGLLIRALRENLQALGRDGAPRPWL